MVKLIVRKKHPLSKRLELQPLDGSGKKFSDSVKVDQNLVVLTEEEYEKLQKNQKEGT
jgi:hypothetical protein